MTDQTIQGNTSRSRPVIRSVPRESAADAARPEPKVRLWSTIDKPLLLIVSLLLIIGAGMVFSTTFNWSLEERGSPTAIFLQDHMRNVVLGVVALSFFTLVDYRFWKRFAPWLMLVTIGALVAVLIFGDDTFGARRALIGGRFQPGELAEFTIVVYMAAWLGARNTRVASVTYGLIPFGVLVGLIAGLVAMQPDFSSAAIIGMTALTMYFLAGARVWYLFIGLVAAIILTFVFTQANEYAQDRLESYVSSLSDPTQSNWHTQQAIIAFVNGGWFGRGIGQSTQKFNNALPAPHTDSIFAVIGEELGVVGASVVVMLYVSFVIRGFQIARRAVDPFGALLVIGFTMWVAIQALLNIAVMTAIVPSSGLPLPFVSYGGSSLLVLMIGVGMMLSVSRVSMRRQLTAKRRSNNANHDRGWGNRRSRLSRTSRG